VLVVAIGLFVASGTAVSNEEMPSPAPTLIGTEICRSCHPFESDHWSATIHARVRATRGRKMSSRGCEACHGPGSEHLKDPSAPEGIIAFTRGSGASIEAMNAMCLDCHAGGKRVHWFGSVHEQQDIACSDCHNPMAAESPGALLAKRSVSETCFSCHPSQRAQFRRRSRMPLVEGKIACSDCHAPHGSVTEPLLDADSVNTLCHRCHAEKRGPYVWEHAPVSESCLNCHRPHGSNHDDLLVAPMPFLCNQCHGQPGSFSHPNDLLTRGNLLRGSAPDERLVARGCVNCHSQIHGSNHPSGARFHR